MGFIFVSMINCGFYLATYIQYICNKDLELSETLDETVLIKGMYEQISGHGWRYWCEGRQIHFQLLEAPLSLLSRLADKLDSSVCVCVCERS